MTRGAVNAIINRKHKAFRFGTTFHSQTLNAYYLPCHIRIVIDFIAYGGKIVKDCGLRHCKRTGACLRIFQRARDLAYMRVILEIIEPD